MHCKSIALLGEQQTAKRLGDLPDDLNCIIQLCVVTLAIAGTSRCCVRSQGAWAYKLVVLLEHPSHVAKA